MRENRRSDSGPVHPVYHRLRTRIREVDPLPIPHVGVSVHYGTIGDSSIPDEVAADAKYKDKEIWIIDILIDSYSDSKNGNYLKMQGQQVAFGVDTIYWGPLFTLSTIVLEPQIAKDFDLKDIAQGYLIEIIGKCKYIIEENI